METRFLAVRDLQISSFSEVFAREETKKKCEGRWVVEYAWLRGNLARDSSSPTKRSTNQIRIVIYTQSTDASVLARFTHFLDSVG